MWWYLLLILPALLIILLFMPIYLVVMFENDEPRLKIRMGFIDVTNALLKEEKSDKSEKKRSEARSAARKKRKKSFSEKLDDFKAKVKLAYDMASQLVKRVTVTDFRLLCRVGTPDAAETAVLYGAVCAAVTALQTFVDETFKVKKKELSVCPDFSAQSSKLDAYIKIRVFVFSLLGAAIRIMSNSMKRGRDTASRSETERKA